MNIKTILNNISDIKAYFKSMYYKSILPDSNNLISENNIIAEQVNKIINTINRLPNYSSVARKEKSIATGVINNTPVYIFANNHMFSLRYGINIDSSSIAYLLTDENDIRYDSRIPGGGVKNKYIEENALGDKFINSRADIGRFDGMPNSASLSVIVRLPEDIKTKYTEETIYDYINKYIPAGVTPVIMYYSYNSMESLGWKIKETVTK